MFCSHIKTCIIFKNISTHICRVLPIEHLKSSLLLGILLLSDYIAVFSFLFSSGYPTSVLRKQFLLTCIIQC